VTAHAHPLAVIRDAIAAGVDGIEHCTFMTEAGMDFAPERVAMLAERQIAVCPTLGNVPGASLPPQLTEILQLSGLTPQSRSERIAALGDAGVRLVSGTDGGIGPASRTDCSARASPNSSSAAWHPPKPWPPRRRSPPKHAESVTARDASVSVTTQTFSSSTVTRSPISPR